MKRFVPAAIFVMMLVPIGYAIAHGPGDGGPGGRMGRAPGVIRQLVFPCQAACQVTANGCSETAASTAIDCVTAACSSQITAAQDACASDATTDACHTAINTLRDCGSSCIDTERTSETTCRTALHDCVDACTAS